MSPLRWMFQFAFGCHHAQLSRVFTIEERTYQVCFGCGREFGYSWKLMHSMTSSVAGKAHVRLHSMRRVGAVPPGVEVTADDPLGRNEHRRHAILHPTAK